VNTCNRTIIVSAATFLACAAGATANPPARSRLLTTEVELPICIASTPADPQHIYACGRNGKISVLDKDTGAVSPGAFLDVTPFVNTDQDNGLLSMAFDPEYASNGFFYINYRTVDGNVLLARYHATPGATVADADSAYTILTYPRNLGHNGGWIGFSPIDHYLYVTSGDGDLGGTLNFANTAQTVVNQQYGKIFRIDPHSDDFPDDPDRNYHIPPDNPFVNAEGDDEIWSYGVRNPWRGSFDRVTGDFYFGDVGMDSFEEIDREPVFSPGGRNYGWPCMEGTHCTGSELCTCNDSGLTLPLYDYPHPDGNCVIGGYVYRGSAIPAFEGLYFFADFLRAKVWSLRPQASGGFTELQDRSVELTPPGTTLPISYASAFGEDAKGELYICNIYGNGIYKLVPYPCLPVVDIDPAAQIRPETANVTFIVAGAGADPLTFRWRKDSVNLSDDGHISGTSSPTLTITNALASDAGVYDAVLTSPCGSTTSAGAELTLVFCTPSDFNHSGQVNVQDIFDFLTAWFDAAPGADFNHNGQIDVQDLFDYLTAWFVGCV
jgi:glucose/arabinose dehydrogenase